MLVSGRVVILSYRCVRERDRVLYEATCDLILLHGRMRSHAATLDPLPPPDRL